MTSSALKYWCMVSLVLGFVGCKSSDDAGERTELTVFAASSLTEAFGELERGFEASRPQVDVQVTFAGSQVLRLQIEQGAPVDVFASANESHMQALADQELIQGPRVFARNELVIIVPTDNPSGIDRFSELDEASRLVIGTDNVPVGLYARQMLERARAQLGDEFVAQVIGRVVSEESNVRLARAKVELGEADAAIVYRTDASSSVRVVSIPDEVNVRANYPIAALSHAPHSAEALAFVAYLLSPAGQEILAQHGFLTGGE